MKLYFRYALIIAFLAQIYFVPYEGFIAPLSVGLIMFGITIRDDVCKKPVLLGVLTGTMALILRIALQLGKESIEFLPIILDSIIVYILYAMIYRFLSGLMGEDYASDRFFTMLMADMLPNLISMVACREVGDHRAAWILIMAAIRSVLVLVISQKNRETQYEKLTSFATNIYADIFFLQKSKKQLDEMTTRSFSIYQALPEDSEQRLQALRLANMGHEVMKDYSNIVSGLAKAIQVSQQESPMLLSQVCRILEAGTRETIAPTRLHIHLDGDILIAEYYDFFIVLNNLIINAYQAGAKNISVTLRAKNRCVSMIVSDDAGGIPEDIQSCIFDPGFSTKFDEQTGAPSPGLGLCHVRDIVNKWNAEITVESNVPVGTTFRIEISSLEEGQK